MWAPRIASDDFEHGIDFDSAGDRFGAKAEGGGGGAFCAWVIFVRLLHGLRLDEQKYCKV